MEKTTLRTETARYALQIVGEQDEYGQAEYAYRFQATMAGLGGLVDLSMMYGVLVEHDGRGDLCLGIGAPADEGSCCRAVKVGQGAIASSMLRQGVDIQARVKRKTILLLHGPTVLHIDSAREPGTRLIAALKRHFEVWRPEVIIDLGTLPGDESFNDYFFPDLDVLGFDTKSSRLFQGYWGEASGSQERSFEFGVRYESECE